MSVHVTVTTTQIIKNWRERAACLDMDSEMFFLPDAVRGPEKALRERIAIRVCSTCPVMSECLDYALNAPEKYGVWGGLTADQRKQLQTMEN